MNRTGTCSTFFNSSKTFCLYFSFTFVVVKQMASIWMAFFVLIGTVGITIGEHYCMDELKNISVFAEPAPCCPSFDPQEADDDACCSNEMEYFLFFDEIPVAAFEIDLSPNTQTLSLFAAAIPLFQLNTHSVQRNHRYSIPPPRNWENPFAVLQVFRL